MLFATYNPDFFGGGSGFFASLLDILAYRKCDSHAAVADDFGLAEDADMRAFDFECLGNPLIGGVFHIAVRENCVRGTRPAGDGG